MKPLSAVMLAAFPALASAAAPNVAPQGASSRPDTVVVTATRQPSRVSDALADVTVISREELEQAGTTSLPELLARQPGLQFYANGGPGQPTGVFIRGATPAQSLVLVDGLRFGSATQGGAALEHLSLDQIERIEIVRGPASALYGADAVGGVIQIFTRQGKGPLAFDAFAGAGRYGTESYALGAGGESGGLRYSLRGSHDKTDGFSAIADPAKQPFSYDPDKDGYRRSAFTANLGWKFAEGHELGLVAQHNEGRTHYDAQDFSGNPFDAYVDSEVSTYGATLRDRLLANWDSTLRVGRTVDDSRDFAPWNPDGATYRTYQSQAGWQNDVRVGPGALLLGVDWVRQQALAEGSYEHSRNITGLFTGWTGLYGKHRLQLNLRRDDNSQFGAHGTGTLAWGWQFLPDWRLRASAGNAFRAPSFNDLYYPGFSNPNLRPERSRNAELGLVWEEGATNLSLTGYRNRIKDMIGLDENFIPQNIARAELDGATLAGGGAWGGFELSGSADWLRAHNPDTDKRLARRAERQASLTASYGLEAWRAGAEMKAVGERFEDAANTERMGAYSLVNLFAHWKLNPQFQLEARVDNLTNAKYETVWGYGTAGVSFFGGLRFTSR